MGWLCWVQPRLGPPKAVLGAGSSPSDAGSLPPDARSPRPHAAPNLEDCLLWGQVARRLGETPQKPKSGPFWVARAWGGPLCYLPQGFCEGVSLKGQLQADFCHSFGHGCPKFRVLAQKPPMDP